MSERNAYEAACEVRHALVQLADTIERIGINLWVQSLSGMRRRDHFAAAIYAQLIGHEKEWGSPNLTKRSSDIALVAAHAWELADALLLADPYPPGTSPATSSAIVDDNTIDLRENLP